MNATLDGLTFHSLTILSKCIQTEKHDGNDGYDMVMMRDDECELYSQ